jgi:5-methylcytosine-specific restriction endonuclease McrA
MKRDRYENLCKKCNAAKAARWYSNNHWRVKPRVLSTESKERKKEWSRRYSRENRDALEAKKNAWRKANPERWAAMNRRSARKQNVRRRAIMSLGELFDGEYACMRDEWNCGICGLLCHSGEYHLDHIIPLARGGKHTFFNVQPSHPKCNLRKGSKMVCQSGVLVA